jgi:hypothetical protein
VKTNTDLARPLFQVLQPDGPTGQQAVRVMVQVDPVRVPGFKQVVMWLPTKTQGGTVWSERALQYIASGPEGDLFDATLTKADVGELSVFSTPGEGLAFGIKPDHGPERLLQTVGDNYTMGQVADRSFVPARGAASVKSYAGCSVPVRRERSEPVLNLPGCGALQLQSYDAASHLAGSDGRPALEVEAFIITLTGEPGRARELSSVADPVLVLLDEQGRERGTLPLNFEAKNPEPIYLGHSHYGMAPGFGFLSIAVDAPALRAFARGSDLRLRVRCRNVSGTLVESPETATIPLARLSHKATGVNLVAKG